MFYAKVILTAYPYIADAVSIIDKQIEKRCSLSFYSLKPCFVYAAKIIDLIENKRRLILLNEKVTLALNRLSDEQRHLIGYKYFKNRPIDGFDYKSRTYFRKQNRALTKFSEYLCMAGISEDIFLSDYANIPYLKSISIRLEGKLAA